MWIKRIGYVADVGGRFLLRTSVRAVMALTLRADEVDWTMRFSGLSRRIAGRGW